MMVIKVIIMKIILIKIIVIINLRQLSIQKVINQKSLFVLFIDLQLIKINFVFLVNCGEYDVNWMFNNSKLKNHQGYLKSNDIVNLSIKKSYDGNKEEFLRSHDIQYTIGSETFQEVVCHGERLGGNDEVSNLIFLL